MEMIRAAGTPRHGRKLVVAAEHRTRPETITPYYSVAAWLEDGKREIQGATGIRVTNPAGVAEAIKRVVADVQSDAAELGILITQVENNTNAPLFVRFL